MAGFLVTVLFSSALAACGPSRQTLTTLRLDGMLDASGLAAVTGTLPLSLQDGRVSDAQPTLIAEPMGGVGISINLTPFATELSKLDLLHLHGGEVQVGSTFGGAATIVRPDGSSDNTSYVLTVTQFDVPQGVQSDTSFSTAQFLALDVSGTNASEMLNGTITGWINQISMVVGCDTSAHPFGCS